MIVLSRMDVKLPEDRNTLIRELYSQGNLTQTDIARMFRLDTSTVCRIVNSET